MVNRKVIYIGWDLFSSTNLMSDVQAVVDAGYTHINLAFWMPHWEADSVGVWAGMSVSQRQVCDRPEGVATSLLSLPISKEDTHSDPHSPGAASDTNHATTNGEVMVGRTMPPSLESLKSCSPHDLPRASAMLCSGFTAGIIVECMRDVQRALPDLGDQLAFRKGFSVDVECMTPGDLHTWRVWEDEHLRLQQPISYMLVDEVFSQWWSDKKMR